MIFEQFYLSGLAQASYLIGSAGTAVVVDPQRDVDLYLNAAHQHGLTIRHIIETHLHADFVSGHLELAERTGAEIWIGPGSGAIFPHRTATEADEISFGCCRLRFLLTPGHSLDSVCILVADLDRGPEATAVLTGDTMFVGDVGRPDLSDSRSAGELAGLLYESLHNKLLGLPDPVRIFPGHGAGSLCGRSIGSEESSTIGRERQFNYALEPMSKAMFVKLLTADLPHRPQYFSRNVELNRRGAISLAALPSLRAIRASEALKLQSAGAVMLDTRVGPAYCNSHISGSINIGLNGQFEAWAGTVLGLDRDLILLTENRDEVEASRRRLARVGIERVAGFLENGIDGWLESGLALEGAECVSADSLHQQLIASDIEILDVRDRFEWKAGHLQSAVSVPLAQLSEYLPQFDRNRAFAVYCKSGYRSAIACSLLLSEGFRSVKNVLGGFDACVAANLPVALESKDGLTTHVCKAIQPKPNPGAQYPAESRPPRPRCDHERRTL